MGNSLSDQLLKAGLASKKQANKVKKAKKVQEKMRRHNKVEVVDEAKILAEKAIEENARKDRALNRQRQQAAEKKAIAAQIKQLIEMNRLPRDDAELSYNFSDHGSIKKLFVTADMQQQLQRGVLAIVKLGEAYELVPAIVADKIRQRDESSVIQRMDSQTDVEEDDPYADYQVPDDLMW
ncbi:MAG TPA: DUF2058 domain-containing protein [Gammaproteobacteria bacterium]|nr:DUF2058 domain-containing protein [Gammaproteobacteria bacterium]